MGAFASGLQGVGQAASDFGQAKFDLADWQQKQRTARLNEIIQGVRLQQIQQQMKQAQQPQPYGIVQGQGGSNLGVMTNPSDPAHPFTTQQITPPSFQPQDLDAVVNNMIASLPEKDRATAGGTWAAFAKMGKYEEGLKEIAKQAGQSQRAQTTAGKLIKGDFVPDANSVTGYARQMMDNAGNVVKTVPNVLVPGMQERISEGWMQSTDQDGNIIAVPKTTVSRAVAPGKSPTPHAGIPGIPQAPAKPQAPGTPATPTAQPLPPGAKIVGHKPSPKADPIITRQVADDTILLNQLKDYANTLKSAGLSDNNMPGFFAPSRFKYSMGYSDKYTDLINKVERFNVTSMKSLAASRNMRMIDLIRVHLPDFWKDSPRMVNQKIQDISGLLEDDRRVKQQVLSSAGGKAGVPDNLFDPSLLEPEGGGAPQ